MSEAITPADVEKAVASFCDPETGRSVTTMEQIREISVSNGDVALTLELTTYSAPIWDEVYSSLETQLRAELPHAKSITVRRAVQWVW